MVRVRRALVASKGGRPAFGAPKTDKGRRGVRLPHAAVEALERHRRLQLDESERLAGLWQDHGLVYCTTIGTPLNRHNLVARSFKPLLRRAGLPDIRFHDLRHTCATLMLRGGIHPKVVQELLGHATISITLATYSYVLPGMDDGLADAMGDALG